MRAHPICCVVQLLDLRSRIEVRERLSHQSILLTRQCRTSSSADALIPLSTQSITCQPTKSLGGASCPVQFRIGHRTVLPILSDVVRGQ